MTHDPIWLSLELPEGKKQIEAIKVDVFSIFLQLVKPIVPCSCLVLCNFLKLVCQLKDLVEPRNIKGGASLLIAK